MDFPTIADHRISKVLAIILEGFKKLLLKRFKQRRGSVPFFYAIKFRENIKTSVLLVVWQLHIPKPYPEQFLQPV